MRAEIAGEDPLELAAAAFARVEADPRSAARDATAALALARSRRHPEAQVAALHALSFAQHQLGDPEAIGAIRAAIRIGRRHGLTQRTALARRRLAMDLAGRGAISAALRELEAARAVLDVHEQARSEVFRVGILWYAGFGAGSLAGTERALDTLRREGDSFWEAQLLRNRGGLLAERGDAAAGETDLLRARELFASLGATAAALAVDTELIRVELVRGDLPACLARLDAVDLNGAPPGVVAEHEMLRAKALAAAQLWDEAQRALTHAQAIWDRTARRDDEGSLDLIRLTLLAGDPRRSLELAQRAQRSFAGQRRRIYAARAASLAIAAAVAAGEVGPAAVRAGRRAAAVLGEAGWRDEALRLRLGIARAALARGSTRTARVELDSCAPLRRRGPVADRIEARHVRALIALAQGDAHGAQREARAGLRLLEQHRAALGASELRATASAIGVELARLGARIALADGRSATLLDWAEALRASALRLAPVTPPRSPELRAAMTELRRVSAELDHAARVARPVSALVARQARLEASIRRLSRHSAGIGSRDRAAPSRRALTGALGDRALVEFIELDERLVAVTLVAGQVNHVELAAPSAAAEQVQWLRFGLAGLGRLPRGAPRRGVVREAALASARELDDQLLRPLHAHIGERPLVVVPTGALHEVPWAALPSLRRRPVVVAPSATAWWSLHSARRRRTPVVLVGGPRLRHARAEIREIGALYPRSRALTGQAATAAAVLRALDGAAVAHLACHGVFRSDSPMFSALELADGPLSAYELQRLRRPPELIILSACELASSGTHPGDELLGFAAALLDLGTRTVIASHVPVPDAWARRLMLGVHRELIAGASPAVALCRAQALLSPRDGALAGFVCLGTG